MLPEGPRSNSLDFQEVFFPDTAQITWSPYSIISKLFGKYFNLANLFFIIKIYKIYMNIGIIGSGGREHALCKIKGI